VCRLTSSIEKRRCVSVIPVETGTSPSTRIPFFNGTTDTVRQLFFGMCYKVAV
jgi:hypothetical protein